MKIYAYGIIDSRDQVPCRGVQERERERERERGINGAGIYNIAYRDIGIVASSFNDQAQETVQRGAALEHADVVERLAEEFTVLPVRFPTIFNNKEDILSTAKAYYRDFKADLVRLRNKAEFGIKIICSDDTIKKCSVANELNTFLSGKSSGKNFLREKFDKYMIEKRLEEEANKGIEVIDNFFASLAVEKKIERLKKGNLLQAFYLVEKEKQNDFKEAFGCLKKGLGNFKYLFSGPWPPYNFVRIGSVM